MKTEQLLPKNIRQIGSPVGHTKVYIEDYVITFLNSLSTDKNTYVRGAILFGEKEMVENDTIIYVKGAIEGQNLELDLDETVFNDEVWREIYQQKDRLFPGLEVIGWALLRMGFSVRLNDKIKKTHFENFPVYPEMQKILFLCGCIPHPELPSYRAHALFVRAP